MGELDETLQAIASLCPENIPELERLPVVELQVGDQCLLIWSEQKEVWRVKSFCADGDVDIVCEKFDAHMAVPKNELRLVVDYQQSKIEQLEKENAHLAEMNKRYLGKMQEQQDMIANAKNIIEKHDRYIPTLTVLALEKALRGECE